MIDYLAGLRPGKIALWCYLIWYLNTVFFHFDGSPRLWLNSLAISVVVGIALQLSVAPPGHGGRDWWQVFRLFAMPFCVSSFSSLIKGQGFLFVFPPSPGELLVYSLGCALFVALVMAVKRLAPRARAGGGSPP